VGVTLLVLPALYRLAHASEQRLRSERLTFP
jgi:hypothetical protein